MIQVEKSRAKLFGGSSGLRKLKRDGLHIVVSTLENAVFHAIQAEERLGHPLHVNSWHTITSSNRCVWSHQEVALQSKQGGEMDQLFEYDVRLYLYNDVQGTVVPLPTDLASSILGMAGYVPQPR